MSTFRLRKAKTLILFSITVAFTMLLCNYMLFFKSTLSLLNDLHPKEACACHRCVGETGGDTWFAERFNQDISPLMSRRSSTLTNETYRWWLLLQDESQPTDFNEVVEKLFQVIPDKELYRDAKPGRCRTCSVVGNSGNLKNSNYGPLIDLSDFVIRMNRGPTKGFEKDVGSRTTHHIMYPESAVNLDNETSLVLIPFKTLDLEWLISALTVGHINFTYLHVMPRIKASKDKVIVYNPIFMKYIYETWLEGHGLYPSTGFMAIIFALHICDEVNVYGFGADQHGNWHHYWEDNKTGGAFRQTGVHDGDYEHNLTMTLASKQKIAFFTGTGMVQREEKLEFLWNN
ncbi:CMP-N-acetylneuraminate-beta-galactosamide-alpha-2,3-sialyltransferase 1-like [Denticeps clupeoides]|uniref:CMP-N-acetylneuraminate-beta-galactosamide-alpha-2,3-sialyltransferase 1 n=1 Tax=Denticeps clupeoides TaxID=299321 RepID=A0AAY4D2K3_9TELE|nr:CMP-N-acetylneuraminate-beta-galactosamide-alpha-2,3-sialyltransferase 1-like [Denticeps clupeoides]